MIKLRSAVGFLLRSLIMFQTFISRHNSNFFSDKLVLTSVTPASSAPVLQTPKATSSKKFERSEERFSRNAETDLVCRLLLEKKKKEERSFYCFLFLLVFFFFSLSGHHRYLHSFPTRRSSYLFCLGV